MTDSTHGPAGTGGTATPGPADGTPKKGMSTGAKVLFACLGLSVLGILGIAAALTVGGLALKRGASSFVASVEEQQEASEALERLEEAHPFEPPEDGVVGEARLERYLAVTGDAWEEIRPWAEDLEQLRNATNRQGGAMRALRDLSSGARAVGGFARSRVVLVEALESHDMSLGEYIWTGIHLSRAADAVAGERPREGVPEENLELAERYQGELPRLEADEGAESSAVLAVATLWGMADLSTWQAMGLDTLTAR